MSFRIEPLFPNYEDGNWDFISGNPFSTIEIEKLIAKIIYVKHCFSSPGLALLLDREKKKQSQVETGSSALLMVV